MSKQEFDSKLRRQALSYPQIARAQVAGFRQGLREASFPPDEVLRGIRHIYITGSGDCNAASAVCKPIVEKLLGGFSAKVYVDTPLQVARYLSLVASDDNPAVAGQTLLIGLSVWGFPARVVECLQRAEKLGIHTLDITNCPDTPVGRAAEYVLNVHDPETPDTHPGCRDYFGTLVGTVLTAAYISEVKGLQPKGAMDALADEIIRLADEYAARMDALDDAMFQLAEEVRDRVDRFEGVGDGYEYASAFFFPAKIIETVGRYATWTDSIHFRKNSVYCKEPGRIFTAFYGEVDAANRESIAQAARLAHAAGREVLFLGDAPKAEFGLPAEVRALQLPKAPAAWPALAAFFNHLPTDLLSAYLCEMWDGHYFRDGSSGSFTAGQVTTIWSQPGMSTLKGSRIVIVEEEKC